MNIYQKLLELRQPKIIILKTSSFGDIVKTIPVHYYLKKVLPNAEITWFVKEKYIKLLHIFGIKNYITQESLTKYIINSCSSLFYHSNHLTLNTQYPTIAFHPSSIYYDVLFDFQGNLKSGFVNLIIPAKYKIGFKERYTKELNFLFRNKCFNTLFYQHSGTCVYDIGFEKLIINTYSKPFELLYKIGFPKCKKQEIELFIPDDKTKNILGWLQKRKIDKFVLLHPGTSKKGKNKRWKVHNYVMLVEKIKEAYDLPSIVILGKEEINLIPFFENNSILPEFEIGLEEMTILIKNCFLFIGNDSGPLHLACILGKKSMGIYPASNPYVMAHPQSHFVSNYFDIKEQQNKNISLHIPFEQVWYKLTNILNHK